MVDHGRLTKVLLVLMASMISGSLLLMKLQGRPIQPMAFSLSQQIELSPTDTVLMTETTLEKSRWQRVEIVYQPMQIDITQLYQGADPYQNDFHFVISNGMDGGEDGLIIPSQRWRKQFACLSAEQVGDQADYATIRVGLSVSYTQHRHTPRQMLQLEELIRRLNRRCEKTLEVVWESAG